MEKRQRKEKITMAGKRTKKHSVLAKAKHILAAQKRDYQAIFRKEVKKGGDSKKAAIRAGSIYRSRYGKTATARWQNALTQAKR